VFSDYARGGMRLSALMEQGVIYVLTHDSIGLGEDGPTHQPVEHLAMLRATPNINVYRPADIIETAECWERRWDRSTPSVLALSRQGLPMLREPGHPRTCRRGRLCAARTKGARDVTLLATGSEVEIAKAAADQLLAEKNIKRRCRFDAVLGEVRGAGRGPTATRCSGRRRASASRPRPGSAGTAGSADGAFVGMESFGAVAPAADLYEHFGITADAGHAEAGARTDRQGRRMSGGTDLEDRTWKCWSAATAMSRGLDAVSATGLRDLADARRSGRGDRRIDNPGGDVNPDAVAAPWFTPLAGDDRLPVHFVGDCVGPVAESGLAATPIGAIALMENLRFHPEAQRRSRTVSPCG
jgi:hypothetical protein